MHAALQRRTFAIIAMLLPATVAGAESFYVAVDGDDQNSGTIDQPFASVQRAQESVVPGDTVHIRGGTYRMQEAQIHKEERIWAHVIRLHKSGTEGKPIRYWAFKNEQPVFDFADVKPARRRVHAFSVSGSWLHIRGIEVVGVQVTIPTHTQSICFANDGNHNIYERLSMHDGMAIGIYSVRGSDNLFLNCDAYNNYDSFSENGRGGNVDGFGCHPPKGGSGNIFRGCRAWFNSDDGFDSINAYESVTFENCWAFWNGYTPDFKSRADGNGFNAGGYASTPVHRLPKPIPRHIVRFCVAVHNRNSGFYANHHIGGGDWINNSAYRNGSNFNLLSRESDNTTDVPGYCHILRNSLSFGSRRLVPICIPPQTTSRTIRSTPTFPPSNATFKASTKLSSHVPENPAASCPQSRFFAPNSTTTAAPYGHKCRSSLLVLPSCASRCVVSLGFSLRQNNEMFDHSRPEPELGQ